jgi:DNA-binding HxlR family transcriptional regulator
MTVASAVRPAATTGVPGGRDAVVQMMQLVGDRWSLLIIRAAVDGHHRFGQLQRHLGIARTVLSARLDSLVEHGLLRRQRYHRDPDWFEYRPTKAALALYPAITFLMRWADAYLTQTG